MLLLVSYNVVMIIRFHIKNAPIKWLQKHARGHADDHSKYDDLDKWSQANVYIDAKAREALYFFVNFGFTPSVLTK
mgnify:CR=1 FL=1